MNRTKSVLVAASLSLAMAFTFSCGTTEGNLDSSGVSSSGGDGLSSSGSSSSGDGGSSSSEAQNNGTSSSSSLSSSSFSSSSTIQGGISYGTLPYEGQNYNTVKIGDQVWMAENLNYDVSGSYCYDDDPANCVKYGRLYDWATAMDFYQSCNSTTCADQIQTPKHQGICPSGWYIPSNADWDKLYRYVDGTTGTSSPYNSSTAGKALKAQTGWDICGPSGYYECKDTYGFSAQPSGRYWFSQDVFTNVGERGYWWSSNELEDYNNAVYSRYIMYNLESANWYVIDKMDLSSVRCLKDEASP